MNEYDLIYEELCERVECGELSLEDAEIINDVAYDRYVNEANVYDKLVNKHVDALARGGYQRKHYAPSSLSIIPGRPTDDSSIGIKGQKIRDSIPGRGDKEITKHGIRKKLWMRNHGDIGKTPEERYKAGRYSCN